MLRIAETTLNSPLLSWFQAAPKQETTLLPKRADYRACAKPQSLQRRYERGSLFAVGELLAPKLFLYVISEQLVEVGLLHQLLEPLVYELALESLLQELGFDPHRSEPLLLCQNIVVLLERRSSSMLPFERRYSAASRAVSRSYPRDDSFFASADAVQLPV